MIGEFYLDKYALFGNYQTSDGVRVWKITDRKNGPITVLGCSIFAKDDKYVYTTRNGIIKGADPNTFVVNEGNGARGKDKDNFYFL